MIICGSVISIGGVTANVGTHALALPLMISGGWPGLKMGTIIL